MVGMPSLQYWNIVSDVDIVFWVNLNKTICKNQASNLCVIVELAPYTS
jgi:hypothetical protein